MRIVDTVISRESGNSVWANVVFVGDGGETVTVRLPCPVPYGGEIGRNRILERALKLLENVTEAEPSDMQNLAARAARFGVPDEPDAPESPLDKPEPDKE